MILSCFRTGLRDDLQRELFLREVSTVQEAYELVQKLDRYHKMLPRWYDPAPRAQTSFQPSSTRARHTTSIGQYKAPNPYIDKGKAPVSDPHGPCFLCGQEGHHAASCPKIQIMDNPTKNEDLEDDPTTGEELHEPPSIEEFFDEEEQEDE